MPKKKPAKGRRRAPRAAPLMEELRVMQVVNASTLDCVRIVRTLPREVTPEDIGIATMSKRELVEELIRARGDDPSEYTFREDKPLDADDWILMDHFAGKLEAEAKESAR